MAIFEVYGLPLLVSVDRLMSPRIRKSLKMSRVVLHMTKCPPQHPTDRVELLKIMPGLKRAAYRQHTIVSIIYIRDIQTHIFGKPAVAHTTATYLFIHKF